jgi:hypothetical protein
VPPYEIVPLVGVVAKLFLAEVGDVMPPGLGLLVQVGHLGSTLGLNVTLARKFGQVCPPFGGVAIGPLAGGVGAVAGDGLVVEIRRIPAQLGGQFSTQTLVVFATCHRCSLRRAACADDGDHDLLLGIGGVRDPLRVARSHPKSRGVGRPRCECGVLLLLLRPDLL